MILQCVSVLSISNWEGKNLVEGFWILQINASNITTGGVMLFLSGRVFGGDNGFTWIGTYVTDQRIVKARVLVQRFDPDIESVLPVAGDYEMHFSGDLRDPDNIVGTAVVTGQPHFNLGITLMRKSYL